MIPQGGVASGNSRLSLVNQPSRTYGLDLTSGRIVGMVDGVDAVKQAAIKILYTERFEHMIYSFNYGSEWTGLIGRHSLFFQTEFIRRVREALLQDDRIKGIEDIRFAFQGDEALISFTVVSLYGNFQLEKGMMV